MRVVPDPEAGLEEPVVDHEHGSQVLDRHVRPNALDRDQPADAELGLTDPEEVAGPHDR
jgi:hypothetical protein